MLKLKLWSSSENHYQDNADIISETDKLLLKLLNLYKCAPRLCTLLCTRRRFKMICHHSQKKKQPFFHNTKIMCTRNGAVTHGAIRSLSKLHYQTWSPWSNLTDCSRMSADTWVCVWGGAGVCGLTSARPTWFTGTDVSRRRNRQVVWAERAPHSCFDGYFTWRKHTRSLQQTWNTGQPC